MLRSLGGVLAVAFATAGCALEIRDPEPEEAAVAIAGALDSVWVVAIGESHGHADLHDLLIEVLADERIRARVDDIVVEFGNARYQEVIDRFVRDEPVPYDSVRLAWRNTVVSPNTVWDSPIYERFFQEVQRLNRESPDGRLYRVLLADSPVDWSSVESIDDLTPLLRSLGTPGRHGRARSLEPGETGHPDRWRGAPHTEQHDEAESCGGPDR